MAAENSAQENEFAREKTLKLKSVEIQKNWNSQSNNKFNLAVNKIVLWKEKTKWTHQEIRLSSLKRIRTSKFTFVSGKSTEMWNEISDEKILNFNKFQTNKCSRETNKIQWSCWSSWRSRCYRQANARLANNKEIHIRSSLRNGLSTSKKNRQLDLRSSIL